jgi:CHAD domain-containing protein|tara:strand:+ start:289 stop:585 length:297 start_codon:yes stop_codon:yes gene_type:complete
MVTLSITPIRIYNTANSEKPKRVRKHNFAITKSKDTDELHQLRSQIDKYKRAHIKLEKLAKWNLRSTKSSLKDVQDTLAIIEDLYGDNTFEDQSGYDQ